MYGTGTKKMLIMMILNILKKYSDEDHHLTQQEIIKLLKSEYGMDCDRRSVKANVEALCEMDYDIDMKNGYALMGREFDDAELRMLIDSVLFSKNITGTQSKRLIDKLKNLGSKFFEAKVSHVASSSYLSRTDNKQVMYTVGALNDAIDSKKKVKFRYTSYGADFKLHDRGKEYVVNPYQMIASNGHYYLLGNLDRFDDISYYRIDKIRDVETLPDKVKPMKQVKGLENGLNLPKHMAEHIYLFCGESIPVKLKCARSSIDILVDWFGKDVRILSENSDEIIARVVCSEYAIHYWALQYGTYFEVIEPKSIRDRLRKDIDMMAEKYRD
ncbi:MAG: WYL domain-containing protein [Lachnospiraceae bacterium]|nr:WYL domain-containing protein [Lachnospiraceae bacterium]